MAGMSFIGLTVIFAIISTSCGTPLDDYVSKDDGYYKYEVIDKWTNKAPGVTSYLLNMTSQRWLTDDDVTRSIWWHDLIVNIPDTFDARMKDSAYMLIEGGSNSGGLPSTTDDFFTEMQMIASTTKSVTALLRQVPNQSLVFKKDILQRSRTEDEIIAYTWRHFIDDPSEPYWLLRMPMTKAAVKAMDTITDFVNKTRGQEVSKFCVGGASKRGWTTWTTGAVDSKRVTCITPIVLDVLNMVENLHHHYRAYGGWSFALGDYFFANVTADLDNPNTQKMADIVDPYSYRDRLTMPKMVISMGDEFFLPDDSHYYLKDMEGPTYVNMVPNDEHEFHGHDLQVFNNIRSFYVSVMGGYKIPKVAWTLQTTPTGGGSIDVTTDTKPVRVSAWTATTLSQDRRDFRLNILDPKDSLNGPIPQNVMWIGSDVTTISETHFSHSVDKPEKGWTAFFIQLGFLGPNGTIFECTTETNIAPNTFPFEDCHGVGCTGFLL
uniref:autocrine proliferation repressor protein A-like isoform X1 n=2 Tax=Styela clava TaxID=7725 RepID=UPI00193A41B5|nr:autocrine proliferation repressor protein A-like isoform X1 [Styela clava]